MATLYHRLPLLAPGSSDLGYGAADAQHMNTIHVIETGPCLASATGVAWPPDGAVGILCSAV